MEPKSEVFASVWDALEPDPEKAKAMKEESARKIAMEETAKLLSVPGMRESIKEGMGTAIKDCEDKLDR